MQLCWYSTLHDRTECRSRGCARSLPPRAHRPDRADRGVPVLARPLHRQHRLPEHLGELPRGEPGLALVGAERLHHRVRRRPGPGRALGGPGRAQEGVPHRPGRLHRHFGAVRRRPVARLPGGGPRPAGDGRRAHAADLTGAAAPRLRARAQGGGHRAVVRRGRCRRRLRPAHRRAAGPGELALGVPGEPALQRAGAGLRHPRAARGARPGGPQIRLARRRAALGVGGRPGGRHRGGLGLGLAQRAHPGRLRDRRRLGRLARRALVPPPEPHHRAGRHPAPRRRPGRPELARLLRRLRCVGPRRRPVPDRGLARVDPAGGLHDRPRTPARGADGLPGRRARGPHRTPRRRHGRLAALRGRGAVVDHPRRGRAGLGRRLPPRQHRERHRRGPDAAVARRRRHGSAAAAALRHGLRALRHDAPDRGRSRRGVPRGHPGHRHRGRQPSRPSTTPGSS